MSTPCVPFFGFSVGINAKTKETDLSTEEAKSNLETKEIKSEENKNEDARGDDNKKEERDSLELEVELSQLNLKQERKLSATEPVPVVVTPTKELGFVT